jgi:voltage-gated potassium channel
MSVIQFWPMLSVISPTGLSITAIRRWSPKSAQRLIVLGWGNLWIIISFVFVVYVRIWSDVINANQQGLYAKIAIFFALSRSVEIAIAFLRDAIGKIKPILSRSKLTKAERIRMVFKSYLELILDFAIVAYFSVENIPASGYEKQFSNISDAIYFSAITITTTGYGDNYPICEFSKYLSVFEVLSGTILLVVALAIYLGTTEDTSGT